MEDWYGEVKDTDNGKVPAPQTKLLKHFVNECHACDPTVGVWPDAKFAKPTGGAMLTIKQTPEAAMAAASSRATAA